MNTLFVFPRPDAPAMVYRGVKEWGRTVTTGILFFRLDDGREISFADTTPYVFEWNKE